MSGDDVGRLAAWLLSLYPQAWRRRYGAEMAYVVGAEGLSARLVIDLLLGALDAHVTGALKGWRSVQERSRRTVVAVFAAAAVYAAAVYGLLETRDQVSYMASPARLAGAVAAGIAWGAMAVAGLACVAGALVVTAGALGWMRRREDYKAVRFVAIPPVAGLICLAAGVALGRLSGAGIGHAAHAPLFVAWLVLLAAAAAACVYAGARLLRVVELPAAVWRLLRAAAWVVAGAIAVGAAALVAYAVAFAALDGRLLGAHDGLLATPLLPTLLAVVLAAVAAAALAVGVIGRMGTMRPSVR